MLKNSLFSPLCLAPFFCFSLFFFFLSALHLSFFFCFLYPTLLFCSSPLFLFFLCVALYFSAQNTSFSAQTFFSPQILFSAQNFFRFSPIFFFFSQFNHSSLLLFSALFFSGSALSFLFQRLLFFFSLAPFIQDPMFSLAASHLFCLNKSLFYSNME